ncbi:MAG: chorismate mutase [Christensenellales bacterium]
MPLQQARERMDGINQNILKLFIERMQLSASIARIKRATGLPVRDAAREEAIIEAMRADSPPELQPYVEALFDTLFALSRAWQEQLDDLDDAPLSNTQGEIP